MYVYSNLKIKGLLILHSLNLLPCLEGNTTYSYHLNLDVSVDINVALTGC